jgi:lysyl-tRNA synthetase class 2
LSDQDNEQIQQRRLHLEQIMNELGLPGYPAKFERTHTVSQIVHLYHSQAGKKEGDELARANSELNPVRVQTSGRMKTSRLMGKAGFAHLSDGLNQIQIYIRKSDVGEEAWRLYDLLDLGDIIGVEGFLFITKTGELSIHVEKLWFLAKALVPMPEKYHGLHDPELKQRMRYADLIANPETRRVFEKRAAIIRGIRRYFDEQGYTEVETPMLSPLATGAAARPFKTHHNALDIDLYARIAPELYLKRLTVGGFEKVYELNRNFRNEGLSIRHNPEFTMLEFYQAYSDYNDLMELTEELINGIAKDVCGTEKVEYLETEIDFSRPWARLTMKDAVIKFWPKDNPPSADELDTIEGVTGRLSELEVSFDPKLNWGQRLGELFENVAETHLISPTFITQFPTELSPLSKQNANDPRYVDRFELYISGMECANAFSELNDPAEQRSRFEEQMTQREGGNDEAMVLDEDYIRALTYGLPPTAGEGIGIDRLTMILTNQRSIREVILFPHMRPETTSH